jgi:hypothetical protein
MMRKKMNKEGIVLRNENLVSEIPKLFIFSISLKKKVLFLVDRL